MDGSIDPVEHPRAGAHRRLLVIPGFWSAITVLAIFLLFAFAATAAEVVEPVLQNAQRSGHGSELPVVPVLPETRGGPSPELPEIQPSAPPPSQFDSAGAGAGTGGNAASPGSAVCASRRQHSRQYRPR
jgi:hypothetical protein